MTAPILAFFSNKGGVGKTSLVYHLAWMYAELGWTVVAADLDPQANLTASCLGEDSLEELRGGPSERSTIYNAIEPLLSGVGDLETPVGLTLAPRLHLLASRLELSGYEDDFSREWLGCLEGTERAFRVTTSLWRSLQRASAAVSADLVLVDLSPHLGAINRAALIASDHIIFPVAPDLHSVRSLQTLGTVLRKWREEWQARIGQSPPTAQPLPTGSMHPAGYVVHLQRLYMGAPLAIHRRSMESIPSVYARSILGRDTMVTRPDADPNCLGTVRRYGSLLQLSQEARKPMFHLKASDGAIGAHAKAVLDARRELETLARRIAAASWDRPPS